jgi:hypothetical protein
MITLRNIFGRKTVSLSIFDIDDTLFRTTASVYVMKNGTRVHKLSPAQFNFYDLKPGETYDFSEFRSSVHFLKTSKPIKNVFNIAKKLVRRYAGSGSQVIALTARSDMDDRDMFLNAFRKVGFPVDSIHIERAGNLPVPAPQGKAIIVRKYLKSGRFNHAQMFDDYGPNLVSFLEIQREFPSINFEAFLVSPSGSISRFTK